MFTFLIEQDGLPRFILWLNLFIGHWYVYNRTVFNAVAASRAKVHVDAAGTFSNLYLEVPGRSFNGFQVCVCDNFNVQMPADLDQFR
jgi:hypothetical protein